MDQIGTLEAEIDRVVSAQTWEVFPGLLNALEKWSACAGTEAANLTISAVGIDSTLVSIRVTCGNDWTEWFAPTSFAYASQQAVDHFVARNMHAAHQRLSARESAGYSGESYDPDPIALSPFDLQIESRESQMARTKSSPEAKPEPAPTRAKPGPKPKPKATASASAPETRSKPGPKPKATASASAPETRAKPGPKRKPKPSAIAATTRPVETRAMSILKTATPPTTSARSKATKPKHASKPRSK